MHQGGTGEYHFGSAWVLAFASKELEQGVVSLPLLRSLVLEWQLHRQVEQVDELTSSFLLTVNYHSRKRLAAGRLEPDRWITYYTLITH